MVQQFCLGPEAEGGFAPDLFHFYFGLTRKSPEGTMRSVNTLKTLAT